jgi:hypothetical protein
MEFLISTLQLTFILFVFSIIFLYLFVLLLTWTWAQTNDEIDPDQLNLTMVLSTAAIEWGAILTMVPGQILGARLFLEAPPLTSGKETARQCPIVFIPSLHTGSGIFRILLWRLKKHFFTSLWPFSWKPFLMANDLLEDQLLEYLKEVLRRTRSTKLRIISFGTSRPLVSRVLNDPSLHDIQKKWIAVSAPKTLSRTLRFLSTPRLKNVFAEPKIGKDPDLVIRGQNDVLCYPGSVWGEQRALTLPTIGHFAALLYPATVQRILEEFS